MIATTRRPLRAGTKLDYCGMAGTVVRDYGGETLEVSCEGFVQKWRWKFEGEECTVVEEPRGQLSYDSFDAYVADFPKGESVRAWLARPRKGLNQVAVIRLIDPKEAGSPHGGIPGNYLWVSLFTMNDGSLRIAANDCDDGLMVRDFPASEQAAAEQVLRDMKELAPFSMWEAAKMFDFKWE